MMATVQEINHDSSTILSDFYDSITDTDGAVTVTPTAALDGSTNGLLVDYDAGSNNAIIGKTFTTLTGDDLRWRIRLKLDNFATTAANRTGAVNFELRNNSSQNVFIITLASDGSNGFQVNGFSVDDNANIENIAGDVAVSSSGEICLEIRAIRETADTNVDGIVEFYMDGVSQGSLTDIDNFNRWNDGIETARHFFLTSDAGFSGDLYFDEWILDDDNAADLGCGGPFSGYDLVLGGGQP
jgi:hypothetical protein